MARYTRKRTTRYGSSSRYARPAGRYSRRPARRRTSRRSTGSGRSQVVKLVIQTTGAPVADAQLPLGMKPGPRPKVAKY